MKWTMISLLSCAAVMTFFLTGCCRTCPDCSSPPDTSVELDTGEDLHGWMISAEEDTRYFFECGGGADSNDSYADKERPSPETDEDPTTESARHMCGRDAETDKWRLGMWNVGEVEAVHYETADDHAELQISDGTVECEHQDEDDEQTTDEQPETMEGQDLGCGGGARCTVNFRSPEAEGE